MCNDGSWWFLMVQQGRALVSRRMFLWLSQLLLLLELFSWLPLQSSVNMSMHTLSLLFCCCCYSEVLSILVAVVIVIVFSIAAYCCCRVEQILMGQLSTSHSNVLPAKVRRIMPEIEEGEAKNVRTAAVAKSSSRRDFSSRFSSRLGRSPNIVSDSQHQNIS